MCSNVKTGLVGVADSDSLKHLGPYSGLDIKFFRYLSDSNLVIVWDKLWVKTTCPQEV